MAQNNPTPLSGGQQPIPGKETMQPQPTVQPQQTIIDTSASLEKNPKGKFLDDNTLNEKDTIYKDLFRTNADGDIVTGRAKKKPPLEIFVQILLYITIILVVTTILGAIHVFIRGQETNALAENIPFLCPYLNYDINVPDAGCLSLNMIEMEYREKERRLDEEIIKELSEYIPLKVASNIIDASAEKTFITTTYNEKINVNTIVNQFEKLRKESEWEEGRRKNISNIVCGKIHLNTKTLLSVECTVFGGAIGDTGEEMNTSLASSRIELLNFLDRLANSPESQFILKNPPTVLSVDAQDEGLGVPPDFKTATTVLLSLDYITTNSPLDENFTPGGVLLENIDT